MDTQKYIFFDTKQIAFVPRAQIRLKRVYVPFCHVKLLIFHVQILTSASPYHKLLYLRRRYQL